MNVGLQGSLLYVIAYKPTGGMAGLQREKAGRLQTQKIDKKSYLVNTVGFYTLPHKPEQLLLLNKKL